MMHLSYTRLEYAASPGRQKEVWDSEFLSELQEPIVEFMEHIRDQQPQYLSDGRIDLSLAWNRLIACLKSGHELVVRANTDVAQKATYSFYLGRQLKGGKAQLTDYFARAF